MKTSNVLTKELSSKEQGLDFIKRSKRKSNIRHRVDFILKDNIDEKNETAKEQTMILYNDWEDDNKLLIFMVERDNRDYAIEPRYSCEFNEEFITKVQKSINKNFIYNSSNGTGLDIIAMKDIVEEMLNVINEIEIERKFLVDETILLATINLSDFTSVDIKQAYLTSSGNEVRVRKEENAEKYFCCLTIKSKECLVRDEVEFEIPYAKYNYLIKNKMYVGNVINKLRHKIPLDGGLVAQLDIYGKELFGLVTVEVEFKTEKKANAFTVPSWFGEEVTYNKEYKNSNLAMRNHI